MVAARHRFVPYRCVYCEVFAVSLVICSFVVFLRCSSLVLYAAVHVMVALDFSCTSTSAAYVACSCLGPLRFVARTLLVHGALDPISNLASLFFFLSSLNSRHFFCFCGSFSTRFRCSHEKHATKTAQSFRFRFRCRVMRSSGGACALLPLIVHRLACVVFLHVLILYLPCLFAAHVGNHRRFVHCTQPPVRFFYRFWPRGTSFWKNFRSHS